MIVEDEPAHRARWLGVVLILLALGALVWQAWASGVDDEPMPVPTVSPPNRPSVASMLAGADTASINAYAASAVALAQVAANAPLAKDEVEACGLGRVKVNAAGDPVNAEALKETVEKARQGALARVLPTLAASSDELVRAAGLLLQSADERARDALARMAMATTSADVYRLALVGCQRKRDGGVCQMLSPAQLARMDPNGLFTWLEVANDAQTRGDQAAVAEALYRASRATRAGNVRLAELVLSRLPAEMSVLDRGLVAGQVSNVQLVAQPAYLAANQHCSEANVRDSNRQQTCLALAEVLNTQGSSLMELSTGIELGRRVGWPAERLAAAAEERDALLQLSNVAARAADKQVGCDSVERNTRRVMEMGRESELGLLRRQLKQSPDGAAVLAAKFRETAAPARAEAASAAASR